MGVEARLGGEAHAACDPLAAPLSRRRSLASASGRRVRVRVLASWMPVPPAPLDRGAPADCAVEGASGVLSGGGSGATSSHVGSSDTAAHQAAPPVGCGSSLAHAVASASAAPASTSAAPLDHPASAQPVAALARVLWEHAGNTLPPVIADGDARSAPAPRLSRPRSCKLR